MAVKITDKVAANCANPSWTAAGLPTAVSCFASVYIAAVCASAHGRAYCCVGSPLMPFV